jgi:hypothetical protein
VAERDGSTGSIGEGDCRCPISLLCTQHPSFNNRRAPSFNTQLTGDPFPANMDLDSTPPAADGTSPKQSSQSPSQLSSTGGTTSTTTTAGQMSFRRLVLSTSRGLEVTGGVVGLC